ncbi:hypothetical protein WDU94_007417 [Cyamophila willieti]
MAVFMINICKFDRCGIIFKNLADLIQHIEENHIDNESSTLQYNNTKEIENATCLPLSYVLRFYTNKVKVEDEQDESIERNGLTTTGSVPLPTENVFINQIQSPPPPPLVTTQQLPSPSIVPVLSSSPQGSELGEDPDEDTMLEDSNDSWTLAEEYSSEYILKHGSKMTTPMDGNVEKPFACPVPGCKKRYKNVNGIKYHSKNGHKTDGRIYKNFKCHCGKSYKTSQGLKTHTLVQHHGSSSSSVCSNSSNSSGHHHHDNTTMTRIQDGDHQTDVLQVPSSRIKALTLKHIEALGVPVKTFVLSRNRTPPPASTSLPSNINVITTAACVKDSNNNSQSNVLEISTSLPASSTSAPITALELSPVLNNTLNNSTPMEINQDSAPMTPVTPTTQSFVHATSTPITIPASNATLLGPASSLLTPATSPSCSPVSSLSSYHSL